MTRALFIALEGIDGSGTTTQTKRLVEWLSTHARSKGAVATKEPWHGGLEDRIRTMIDLDPQPPPWHMAAAFLGDRAAHVACWVQPSLDQGLHVVSDRYMLSTMAYQLPVIVEPSHTHAIRVLNSSFLRPDLTVLLDLPVEMAKIRMTGRQLDSYERHLDFQRRVRAQYLEAAQKYDGRVEVIDASDDVQSVQESIRALVEDLLCAAP